MIKFSITPSLSSCAISTINTSACCFILSHFLSHNLTKTLQKTALPYGRTVHFSFSYMGNSMTKQLPFSRGSTKIFPPCIETSSRTIASPRPLPLLLRASSTLYSLSKTNGIAFSGIPTPLSQIFTAAVIPACSIFRNC